MGGQGGGGRGWIQLAGGEMKSAEATQRPEQPEQPEQRIPPLTRTTDAQPRGGRIQG